MGKLYGIGVGPGDSELITIKAVKTIEKCDVIVVPSAKGDNNSIALEIAKPYINSKSEVLILHFPMSTELEDVNCKVFDAFIVISQKLKEGKNVGFLTIGDPFVFSTYIYLLKYIDENGFEIETIPGITSFCACASIAQKPLVIGDEALLIIPASKINEINNEKYVVVMKVYKCEEKVINVLEEKGFDYVYVKRCGREGQAIFKDKKEIINNREYMALIIANRKE